MKRGDYSFLTKAWIQERFIVRDDGVLIWRKGQRKGQEAGHDDRGYIRICFYNIEGKKRNIYAHLIVWVWHYGFVPVDDIDHINQIKSNNWIENLREITRSKNLANRGKCRGSKTSKFKGVSKKGPTTQNHKKIWQAEIRINRELVDLGRYYLERHAALAYDRAARDAFGNCAVLNFPYIESVVSAEKS